MICMAEGGQRKGLLSRSSDVMPEAVKIGWLNLLPALYPMKIWRCHSGKKPRLRYSVSCSAYGQGAVIGKLAFCKFVDYYNFENYFRIGELNDSELLCLASFLYHKECYLILMDMLCKNSQFKRTRSVMDREEIYVRIQRYKKQLQPDYDRGLCLETVRCIFTLPKGEAEKCRITHGGQETYAFIMSNKYILGLFTYCEAARKSAAADGVEYGHLAEPEKNIVLLDGVRDVLFQALLLDDVEYNGSGLSANLHTIYCLNKKE